MKTVYFDTETTSSELKSGQICQIAYLMEGETGDPVAKNFFFAVDRLSEGSALVTGLALERLRELSGGRTFSEAAAEIAADFSDALLVAHNFRFDYYFLQEELGRSGRILRYREELDTAKRFQKILRLPRDGGGFRRPSLAEICAHYGISEFEIAGFCKGAFGAPCAWHDARFDASAVWLAVKRAELMGELREKGEKTC